MIQDTDTFLPTDTVWRKYQNLFWPILKKLRDHKANLQIAGTNLLDEQVRHSSKTPHNALRYKPRKTGHDPSDEKLAQIAADTNLKVLEIELARHQDLFQEARKTLSTAITDLPRAIDSVICEKMSDTPLIHRPSLAKHILALSDKAKPLKPQQQMGKQTQPRIARPPPQAPPRGQNQHVSRPRQNFV